MDTFFVFLLQVAGRAAVKCEPPIETADSFRRENDIDSIEPGNRLSTPLNATRFANVNIW